VNDASVRGGTRVGDGTQPGGDDQMRQGGQEKDE
jgi:hypothetical protein